MPKSKKFKKLIAGVKEYYIEKPVPKKYQGKYGKVYDEDEAEQIAYAIAKKKKWRV